MALSGIAGTNERSNVPLLERGRTEGAFGGLGPSVATVLLLGGTYLMTEALLNPLSAPHVGLLRAGFALALASVLFVYPLSRRRRNETATCAKKCMR